MKKKFQEEIFRADNKELIIYTVIAGEENFTIIIASKKDNRKLKIPYKDFELPYYTSEKDVLDLMKEQIKKFFKGEEKKIISIHYYSAKEKEKIKQIIEKNKKDIEEM